MSSSASTPSPTPIGSGRSANGTTASITRTFPYGAASWVTACTAPSVRPTRIRCMCMPCTVWWRSRDVAQPLRSTEPQSVPAHSAANETKPIVAATRCAVS